MKHYDLWTGHGHLHWEGTRTLLEIISTRKTHVGVESVTLYWSLRVNKVTVQLLSKIETTRNYKENWKKPKNKKNMYKYGCYTTILKTTYIGNKNRNMSWEIWASCLTI